MHLHSTSLITIARDRRFLIVICECRFRQKSLCTSIVAGTVKLNFATIISSQFEKTNRKKITRDSAKIHVKSIVYVEKPLEQFSKLQRILSKVIS